MGFMNGIYEWDISMSHCNCYSGVLKLFDPKVCRSYSRGWGGGGSDKGLKHQPRDSDMNILGYFEDIKNTAKG